MYARLKSIIARDSDIPHMSQFSDVDKDVLVYIIDNYETLDSELKEMFDSKYADDIAAIHVITVMYKILHGITLDENDQKFFDYYGFPQRIWDRNNPFYASYAVETKEELRQLIDAVIQHPMFGTECNLNWIDMSGLTNMDRLFCNYRQDGDELYMIDGDSLIQDFDGDISLWDVSNVTSMREMFMGSSGEFSKVTRGNGIAKWDVSNVRDMHGMFMGSSFDGRIESWDVSNVRDMGWMFHSSSFDGDISEWDVSHVKNMDSLFYQSSFNGLIGSWDVRNVKSMTYMFAYSCFDSVISKWDVSNVEDMSSMFEGAEFNGSLFDWDINEGCKVHHMFFMTNFDMMDMPKRLRMMTREEFDSSDIM